MSARPARDAGDERAAPNQGEPFVGARDFPPAEMRWPPPTDRERGQARSSYGSRCRALAWIAILVACAIALVLWLR